MTEKKKIVKNKSKAYGYNYSSLADIVEQGFEVPLMRVKPTELGEFMEYKDEAGEWQTGSKIVVPDMKGSNAAQAYGAALTYARRYTAQMALGLVCDEDKKLERTAPEKCAQTASNRSNIDFKAVNAQIKAAKTIDELDAVCGAIPEPLKKYFVANYKLKKAELDGGAE